MNKLTILAFEDELDKLSSEQAEQAAQKVLDRNRLESNTAQAGVLGGAGIGGLLGSAAGDMAGLNPLTGPLVGGVLGAFGGNEIGTRIADAFQRRRMRAADAAAQLPEAVKQAGLAEPVKRVLERLKQHPGIAFETRNTDRGTETFSPLFNPGPNLGSTKPLSGMEVTIFPKAKVSPTIGIGMGGLQSRLRIIKRNPSSIPSGSVVGTGLDSQSAVTGGAEVGIGLRRVRK